MRPKVGGANEGEFAAAGGGVARGRPSRRKGVGPEAGAGRPWGGTIVGPEHSDRRPAAGDRGRGERDSRCLGRSALGW